MGGLTFDSLCEHVGRELGVSDWVSIDQARIDTFANCTGDCQWIHVDVERAKRESPFRGPIPHGYLTLAIVPPLAMQAAIMPQHAGVGLNDAIDNEPKVAAEQWLSFLGELAAIAGGKSERVPKAGDRRFSDPTWKESGLHRGLLKAYLAWGEAVGGLVDKTSLSDVDKARAHLITEILIDAVAPTNAMLTNPAAVRKFVDTGRQSLWLGVEDYFEYLLHNPRTPSLVDASAFKVGENLATT